LARRACELSGRSSRWRSDRPDNSQVVAVVDRRRLRRDHRVRWICVHLRHLRATLRWRDVICVYLCDLWASAAMSAMPCVPRAPAVPEPWTLVHLVLLGERGETSADIAIGGVDALDVGEETDRLLDLAGHLEREGQLISQGGAGIG